jgi:carbon storage regulator
MRFYIFQRSETVLVLSRLKEEEIVIGDNIRVKILDVRGDKVRLGITAPRDVSVHRLEVYEAIKAAETTTDSDCD